MDTWLKAFCHQSQSTNILLSLISEFFSKVTLNYPNHCQDNNEDVFSTKHCLPTP